MKRLLDILVSLSLLMICLPVMVVVGVVVWLDLGRPIFFVQERPGLGSRIFTLYKFRTMREPNPDGLLDEGDAERMTKVGRVLRSTSLDELPQLWNVLKGEMSLVGPRPLLTDYLSLYNERQAQRHDVRPGITGWAQINGRNNVSWKDKFELDIWYVENQSFWLDLRIIFLTFKKVVGRKDISAEDHATSVRFTGNDD